MIPKAELHCHIEGTASVDLVLAQAKLYKVDASKFVDPARGYLWVDFNSFLSSYDFVASLIRTPEDYLNLTLSYFTQLHEQGAIYGEIFVSPDHAARIGCDYLTLVEAIAEGINLAKSKFGIEGRIIVVGVRHAGVTSVEKAALLTTQNPHAFVTGFGMAGDERFGELTQYKRAFEIARDGGLQLTVHAGEFCGADSVRQAVEKLNVARIGHGVRAVEDASLVKLLAEKRIPLEVCAGSNLALNVYESILLHPLKQLVQAGCNVTLNSDDPPHFHTSLSREYDLAGELGFDDEALLQFTRNAIDAAFVDEKTRAVLSSKCTLDQTL